MIVGHQGLDQRPLFPSLLKFGNLARGDEDPAALLRHISPVAWQHINFYGRFEFASIPMLLDIEAIVQDIIARSTSADPDPTSNL